MKTSLFFLLLPFLFLLCWVFLLQKMYRRKILFACWIILALIMAAKQMFSAEIVLSFIFLSSCSFQDAAVYYFSKIWLVAGLILFFLLVFVNPACMIGTLARNLFKAEWGISLLILLPSLLICLCAALAVFLKQMGSADLVFLVLSGLYFFPANFLQMVLLAVFFALLCFWGRTVFRSFHKENMDSEKEKSEWIIPFISCLSLATMVVSLYGR